jgi:hypothetical protein
MSYVRTILAIALLAAPAPGQAGPKAPFEARYFAVHGRRVDTQFWDYTGDGVLDALVVSIDFDADPPTRWFALHVGKTPGGMPEKPDQIWSAAPTTCAYALGNVVPEGGIELLELAPDGISYHAFEKGAMTEEARKLLHTRTFFTTPSDRSLPLWMGPVDLSNDKLDDLIIPVPDGFKIYFQTAPGLFGIVEQLEAGMAPAAKAVSPTRFAADWERLIARNLPSTAALFNLTDDLPRLSAVDLNGDDLKELVALNGSRLTVFFQNPVRKFPAKDRKQQVVQTLVGDKSSDAVSVTDVQLFDVDGDTILDLIVTKIQGELGLLESIKTRIYVHLGTGKANFRPDSEIFIDGISLNPMFIDMDGDKGLDVLTTRLRTDIIAKGLEGAFFGDITVTYEVFQFDPKTRKHHRDPVFWYDVRIPKDEITRKGAASRPLFQVPGDLSGDGRPDAVYLNPKTSKLEVRKGRVKWAAGNIPQIDFELDAAGTFDIDRENPPKWMSYNDLDGDGRKDIILNYYGQLVMLLSRF